MTFSGDTYTKMVGHSEPHYDAAQSEPFAKERSICGTATFWRAAQGTDIAQTVLAIMATQALSV